MPKQNKSMTAREQEICERALFVRKEVAKWSQPALARELGITQHQLAGVEYRRAPLRYKMAIFLCSRFNINQRWLASGVLPIQPMFDVPMEYSYLVKPNSVFSRVFDGWLDEPTKRIEDGLIKMVGEEDFRAGNFDSAILSDFPQIDAIPSQAMVVIVKKRIGSLMNRLPEDLLMEYAKTLLLANKSFQTKFRKQLEQLSPPAERRFIELAAQNKGTALAGCKPIVDSSPTGLILPAVSSEIPTWKQIITALKRLTNVPGAKSKLAMELKTSRQNVNKWLSGAGAPSAELTLEVFRWVEKHGGWKQK
jgi:transcriptional regulator with XRE-family HTH domain